VFFFRHINPYARLPLIDAKLCDAILLWDTCGYWRMVHIAYTFCILRIRLYYHDVELYIIPLVLIEDLYLIIPLFIVVILVLNQQTVPNQLQLLLFSYQQGALLQSRGGPLVGFSHPNPLGIRRRPKRFIYQILLCYAPQTRRLWFFYTKPISL